MSNDYREDSRFIIETIKSNTSDIKKLFEIVGEIKLSINSLVVKMSFIVAISSAIFGGIVSFIVSGIK